VWIALILSVLIGASLGLFGGGGSILTVPMLVYVVDIEPKPAIAMSLLIVGLTSVAALVPHARSRNVRWRTGLVFGLAGMVGAYGGGRVSTFVPGAVLLLLFAGMMLATSVAMWRGRDASEGVQFGPRQSRSVEKIVLDGLIIGAFTGLVGAGGGFLVVPALALLGGLPMAEAIGTSLLVIAMKSFAGYTGYAAHVQIDRGLALAVSGAAALGAFAGARLTAVLDPDRLRRAFAAVVFVMALIVLQREAGSVLASASPTAVWLAGALLALVLGALLVRRSPGSRWKGAH
jgi:uncharacterized membrane protein YfcA